MSHLKKILFAVFLSSFALFTWADPVEFDVVDFTYDATGLVIGTPDLTVDITPADPSLAFPISLSLGETSPVFEVLSISVNGFAGLIAGFVEATINFSLPTEGSVSGTGFGVGGLFAFTGAGGIGIVEQPDLFNYGGGTYQVEFFGFHDTDLDLFAGIEGSISAAITLVSVPEPGTLGIAILGIICLGLLRRERGSLSKI